MAGIEIEKKRHIVCGAGIVGLAMARRLVKNGHRDICVIEAEESLGRHASGRNSGVLHSGIYYPPDSLKARFALRGNRFWKDYCREHGLSLLETGKYIVPTSEEELKVLEELYARTDGTDVRLEWRSEASSRRPPESLNYWRKCLYVDYTAVVDSKQIMDHLKAGLQARGVEFVFGAPVHRIDPRRRRLITPERVYRYDRLYNCAGFDALRLARQCGLGKDYRFLPFRGEYLEYQLEESTLPVVVEEAAEAAVPNVYPVPDLRFPFLGVHVTPQPDGTILCGPTAFSVFAADNYSPVSFWRGVFSSLIPWRFLKLLMKNRDVRRLYSYYQSRGISIPWPGRSKKWLQAKGDYIKREVERLIDLPPGRFVYSRHCGVRPQLVRKKDYSLVTDFVVERGEAELHVLGAISPAFTCAVPFAAYLLEHEDV